ncbi:MAG: nuclear transport factor 2 family protein [Eudoraea sp.]|nr:nuclear transport factor 2 family protein [Eudoraea sp.]
MKLRFTITLVLALTLIHMGCKETEEKEIIPEPVVDIVQDEFPEYKAEIKEVLDGIFQSFKDKDADRLIAFHVYGPKFTEFRNDGPRFGSAGNEEYERGFVGAIEDWDSNLNDLKIDVFGEVAVVTFEADFRPTMQGNVVQIWANVTLVFVKTEGEWKITHEHFSQFEKEA